jgi:hypothetical protein
MPFPTYRTPNSSSLFTQHPLHGTNVIPAEQDTTYIWDRTNAYQNQFEATPDKALQQYLIETVEVDRLSVQNRAHNPRTNPARIMLESFADFVPAFPIGMFANRRLTSPPTIQSAPINSVQMVSEVKAPILNGRAPKARRQAR